MFQLPEFDLGFDQLTERIEMITTMIKLIAYGVPILIIVLFSLVMYMFIMSYRTLRNIEKHLRVLNENLKRDKDL